jgi:hypothetical protein
MYPGTIHHRTSKGGEDAERRSSTRSATGLPATGITPRLWPLILRPTRTGVKRLPTAPTLKVSIQSG